MSCLTEKLSLSPIALGAYVYADIFNVDQDI